jgi:hypothetical protein
LSDPRPRLIWCCVWRTEDVVGVEVAEDLVDGVEDSLTRAMGDGEGRSLEDLPSSVEVCEQLRLSAAPGIEGLLDIPDTEETSVGVILTKDFIAEWSEHLELKRGGILEFVKQEVFDGRIESEVQAAEEFLERL